MELFDALYNRRSIRKYSNKQVSDDDLAKIIEAGMFAPSAVNKQPWHFVTFRSKDTIRKIISVHPNAKMLEEASAGILICYDELLQHDKGFGPVDCSAAAQNMLLATHALGLGGCWLGIYPRQNRIDELGKVFKLPEHVIPFAVISVGYPAETKTKPDRFTPDRIHHEKW